MRIDLRCITSAHRLEHRTRNGRPRRSPNARPGSCSWPRSPRRPPARRQLALAPTHATQTTFHRHPARYLPRQSRPRPPRRHTRQAQLRRLSHPPRLRHRPSLSTCSEEACLSVCFDRTGKGMKLGGKSKTTDIVDSLIAENKGSVAPAAAPAATASVCFSSRLS